MYNVDVSTLIMAFPLFLILMGVVAETARRKGYKHARLEMRESYEQFKRDVDAGYPDGYNGLSLEKRVINFSYNC